MKQFKKILFPILFLGSLSSCVLSHNITMFEKTTFVSCDSLKLSEKKFNVGGAGVFGLFTPNRLQDKLAQRIKDEGMVGLISLAQTNRNWFGLIQYYNVSVSGLGTGSSLQSIFKFSESGFNRVIYTTQEPDSVVYLRTLENIEKNLHKVPNRSAIVSRIKNKVIEMNITRGNLGNYGGIEMDWDYTLKVEFKNGVIEVSAYNQKIYPTGGGRVLDSWYYFDIDGQTKSKFSKFKSLMEKEVDRLVSDIKLVDLQD